ncbi:hypothetical protein NL676_019503 [Syzygium grande]|nr:hypothetical protein NL676_019503 [Syzygium grande]
MMSPDSMNLANLQLTKEDKARLFSSVAADMERLAQAGEGSGGRSFWPFGNYLFCSDEGAICLDNAVSINKMMHLMLWTGSPNYIIEEHLKYGQYVERLSHQPLRRSFTERHLSESSYEASLSLALNSLGTYRQVLIAPMAKDCLKMARQIGRAPNLNAANLAIALSKITPYNAEIEWYKAWCDKSNEQRGYYDFFKQRGASKREFKINMNRFMLAAFWDNIIHMMDRKELSHDLHRRSKWVNASQFYMLLVEPLDIAEYYRSGMHLKKGHYISNGRERRYEIFDQWWSKGAVRQKLGNRRTEYVSLTLDSCFWARVEEAKEWLNNIRSQSDPRNLAFLWDRLNKFETYAMSLVEGREIFCKKSPPWFGFMKLTCLSRGKGFYFPPCHVLSVCGFRILIDCPMDLSALAVFAPVPPGFSAVQDEEDFEPLVDEFDRCESGNEERKNIEKPMNAKALIRSEPWYKTVANLHLWNLSFIDVVLISSPAGMLGLPFLTQAKGFSAKVYVNEAAAKLGKLMMEDLVSMHEEFRQFYGPEEFSSPHWMKWEELESLPYALKEIVLGTNGIELGGWMPLYRGVIKLLLRILQLRVDAVKAGGSVLIPIGQLGIILQLLDQISICLESSHYKVPIFVISSVAEELLAYTNIIPEWVCKQRRGKLFPGEPLFAHVELLNGERLQVYPAIYSPKLLLNWREPCIVFCPHWSLRLGPAVHLLRRWHGDERSSLIWEEGEDSDIALLPFDPKEMKMKLSVRSSNNSLPLQELLLLSPSPYKRSKTRLTDRLKAAEEPVEGRGARQAEVEVREERYPRLVEEAMEQRRNHDVGLGKDRWQSNNLHPFQSGTRLARATPSYRCSRSAAASLIQIWRIQIWPLPFQSSRRRTPSLLVQIRGLNEA